MSSKEDSCVKELTSRLRDLLRPDVDEYELRKWLVARNFDVAKAEKMYRESCSYKTKMNTENLFWSYKMPEVIAKYFPGGMVGFDKDGRPAVVELFGKYDMEGLMRSCKRSDLERIKLFQCETAVQLWKEQSNKLGKRVDGTMVIFDMEGVGAKFLWRPGLEMYLSLVQILEDNYPEMLKRLFVVNAPMIFPILWRMTKPLVSAEMRKKIFVLDANYKKELLEFIDPEYLPAYLGGTLTDPDGNPRCVTKICQGGQIPESFYLEKTSEHEMSTTVINSGEAFKVDISVDKVGTILCWQFRTEGHDISFEVQLIRGENGKSENVIPNRRLNSALITEDGSHICKEIGTYQVIFDNSYSWTRSKKLFHRVWVVDGFEGSGGQNGEGLENIIRRFDGATETRL